MVLEPLHYSHKGKHNLRLLFEEFLGIELPVGRIEKSVGPMYGRVLICHYNIWRDKHHREDCLMFRHISVRQ